MTDRLVGPLVASTPSRSERAGKGPRPIPEDLLQEASRRLGIVSLTGAVLWLIAPLLNRAAIAALAKERFNWLHLDFEDAVSLASAAVSLALYVWARRTSQPPRRVLNVGLVFMLFTCLAIAMLWHLGPVPVNWMPQPMFTWVGIIVLMFAATIPHPPRVWLVCGLLAVTMNPVGMLIARSRGVWDFDSWTTVMVMHYPDYLLVGVAVMISSAMTRLGQQVSRARELGSYHVGELIGRGGMGEVYRASHRMLARPAAIKLIRPETIARGDSNAALLAVKRFRREADIAASLQSPHTVALYDFGVTDDKCLYFVMELLEGLDLEKLVRRHGALPPARAIHILRQVCASLEEAHVRGLVHRDIKPANIHVGRLGLIHDFVKVLDFGLAKAFDRDPQERRATAATQDGMVPGTPDFMAPEMTLGEAVDGRADLYAVGCVGYFLLTGQPVFDSSNAFHAIAMHLHEAPRPLAGAPGSNVPPELEQVILACLRKKPADRPQTAGELSRMLAAVPVPPWTEAMAAEWWAARAAAPAATD